MSTPLWQPPDDAWERSRLGLFAERFQPEAVGDYQRIWSWSVEHPTEFWTAIWNQFNIMSRSPADEAVSAEPMPDTRWFSGAALNYAEHMLRGNGMSDEEVAVVSHSQSRSSTSLTLGQLRDRVRRAAAGLRRLGVAPGDRVAAYLPNIDETLVAFLATASIGAVWSSCAPEFGVRAVLDRWSQIEPTVLLVVDGYQYGDKRIPVDDAVSSIRAGLPSVQETVVLRYLADAPAIRGALDWEVLERPTDEPLTFQPVPFDHPLYVLFSSGTTGLPKSIVHGHGGMLLEHTKQLALHLDLGPGDRFFWFSTTGWMMWNFLVSGLLVGSSVVLFDGNPAKPDLGMLWELVELHEVTYAGFAAPWIMACRDAGLHPATDHNLSKLRGIGSTGAPLPAAGFGWIADEVGPVPVSSISGGTDVCSAFVGGAPVLPVTAGVIPCRQLGWAIDAFDVDGKPVRGREGELVITAPAPSMPVGFWNDDGTRYRDAYFDTYPGTWRHGDWITINDDGSCVISGRSDATLNRGGVRLGTADFYAVVEADPAITDSLAVHLEDSAGGSGELLLFVAVAEECVLDDATTNRLTTTIRQELSPRHTPDEIVPMPSIPTTLSGKKLEVPVKRILQGMDPERAASAGALADRRALQPYVAYARSRS
jgi:acetoacetyl-CoA synthetase